MNPNDHRPDPFPPPMIPPGRLPTAIMVATGGDEEGRLVMLGFDTPQGRSFFALPVDNTRQLIGQLDDAIRQIETGLQVIEGADAGRVLGNGHGPSSPLPQHNGRVTRPPGR